MRRGKSNPESGYALLLVFAMAAIVAITLYTEVPRVAFEAQRDKEDLLMSRGHEYIRAITLFVRKYNRFPATMDELENTNNIRYLRRQYTDPMTGKKDWRLLHAGPGGVITDSVISTKKADPATQQNFITEMQMVGSAPAGDADAVNPATRRRASDQPGSPSAGNGSNSGYNGPVMVLPDGSIVPASTTGLAPAGGAQAGGPQGLFGVPGASGGSMPPLPNGVAVQQPASPDGQNNTPPVPPQLGPPNGAAALINQILTSPRPGGINGLAGGVGSIMPPTTSTSATTSTSMSQMAAPTGTATATGGLGSPVGPGLAGVASKREQQGIKTYNERTKYNEWEFFYDITKDPVKNGRGVAGAPGAAGASGAQGASGASSAQSTTTGAIGGSQTPATPALPPATAPTQ